MKNDRGLKRLATMAGSVGLVKLAHIRNLDFALIVSSSGVLSDFL